ncbi:24791_t:CDS:2 [Cetraspora pellucida]|uniref:24791_t:CDS:1 n=1 Tax=Cetraspora pellucida TaxID=1433469 RepID=A0A9N9CC56_9GLOM|nr:24791_t:CDS:2 [Cetraspora pellucida]
MEENSGPSVANLSEVDTEELDHIVQTNKKNKRGWPKNPLWNHFVEINYQESGHKAIFTADEMEKVLINICIDKFGAVVSDDAFAMSLAKQYISDKYPKILPVQCIAHHIQLICSDIICKTLFGKKVLQQYQSFVIYFHASHRSDNDNSAMTLELQNLIHDHQFWANAEVLAKVLAPAKNAVKIAGSKGIKSLVFQDILHTALEIWKKLGGELASANILVAQIKMYDAFEPPYNYTFMESVESLQTWWNGCKMPDHYLQKLALHLLAITLHSASCEHIFSILS